MNKLSSIRRKIDAVDKKIMLQLTERQRLSILAGKAKSTPGVHDKKREAEIIKQAQKIGKKLDAKFVKKICELILQESRRIQKK